MGVDGISRRGLLRGAGLASLAGIVPSVFADRHRHHRDKLGGFRLAHITDCHIAPGTPGAKEGFAKCLQHLQNHGHVPDLVLNGGDSIFDAGLRKKNDVSAQWATFHSVYKENCSLQMVSCIGNHDLWGWDPGRFVSTRREDPYARKWAMDELNLTSPYYSIDRGGWHFIVLDSVRQTGAGAGYEARLDEPQFHWLCADLAKTPATTPVLVLSHCPILSASALMRPQSENGHGFEVPKTWMHADARRIKDLFVKHPNVKLCLAGHEHLHGMVEYDGVTYACNGAVSGHWWQGQFEQTPPGYAMVDLFPDGGFKVKYQAWA